MNEEQLLQEARLEAEKVYPKNTPSHYLKSREDNGKKQTIFIKGYIAHAKKSESEAVAFHKWTLTAILPHSCRIPEVLYEIFKAQQKQE